MPQLNEGRGVREERGRLRIDKEIMKILEKWRERNGREREIEWTNDNEKEIKKQWGRMKVDD